MRRLLLSHMCLTLLLLGLLSGLWAIPQVEAADPLEIYISLDGSVNPANPPNFQYIQGERYWLTGDLSGTISVWANDITIEGNNYALRGIENQAGIYIGLQTVVTIQNFTLEGFQVAISSVGYNHGSQILNNTIIRNTNGIALSNSSSILIQGNTIIDNTDMGIFFTNQGDCSIINNTIANNAIGIRLMGGSYNSIYHNNFVNNDEQVLIQDSWNEWDNDYPSGGNYWSDYNGEDVYIGSDQDLDGNDGIGDTPYMLENYNQDNYPLMAPPTGVETRKIPTTIYCNPQHSSYYENSNVTINGEIIPAVADVTVYITINITDFPPGWIYTNTTDSDGKFQYTFLVDYDGTWSIQARWDGDQTHYGAESSIVYFWVEEKCFIATATYGSDLSPEVQFLRTFREKTVLTTFTGQQFMEVFNGIYYTFSPSVALGIAGNEGLRTVMREVLSPLIWILQFGEGITSRFTFSADLSIIVFCLVVSAMLSLVYLVPWALLVSFWKRRIVSAKIVRLGSYLLVGSLAVLLVAVIARSPLLTMISGAVVVLVTTGLTTLWTTRNIMKRMIHP